MCASAHKQIVSPPPRHRIPNPVMFSSAEALGCCAFPGVSNTCFSCQPHKPFWQRCFHTAVKAVWKGTERSGGFVWLFGGVGVLSVESSVLLAFGVQYAFLWPFCQQTTLSVKLPFLERTWKIFLPMSSKCLSKRGDSERVGLAIGLWPGLLADRVSR